MACNTKRQQSTSLESYLIKPIQRILKYPLLLQQLKNATPPGSEEHRLLVDALISMERVAEHINEMQRIHEEYGAIFDHLFRQHQKVRKKFPPLKRPAVKAAFLRKRKIATVDISSLVGAEIRKKSI